jgi:guanine nucleotide-binding protein G(i) subunit alpha
MGNACGGSSADPAAENKNKQITQYLREEKKRLDHEVKLLLLGAGESGKSTIAKQMKIIHLDGFSEEERLSYKSIIYNNTITSMKNLIRAIDDLKLNLLEETKPHAETILASDATHFGAAEAEAIKALWKDPGIQQAFSRQAEFQLNDSAAYYFEAVDRLALPNYIPSEQDVLRSRAKTTGIIETEFTVDKTKFLMVDVGGQRSERKKWMHCFQDVTSVIFCVALSEYDLKLYEDDTTNRMYESLKLFKEICNSKWFINTSMILFLNKKDIFEKKIKTIDLNVCFEDYTGGCNYENATAFIKDKFLSQNENNKKHIYPHITTATDTQNIIVVFNAVKDIILHQVLDDSGLGI